MSESNVLTLENIMYAKLPNLVLGFHGCDKATYDGVLRNGERLHESTNDYDWLGNGIYFWEASYERALEWAQSHHKENPAVIGAVIDLGFCLNLTDYSSAKILKTGYELLKTECEIAGTNLPKNKSGKSSTDVLLRRLDCAVIERIHKYNEEENKPHYDSVRGIFTEGAPVYPDACIMEKTHIQLCIRNPNCIKGYFAPVPLDSRYSLP